MRKPRCDPKDVLGTKVGLLQVEELETEVVLDSRGKRLYKYKCLCECGRYTVVRRESLKDSHTQSCGCLKKRSKTSNPGWRGAGELSGYLWARIRNHCKRGGGRVLAFTLTIEEAWALFERQQGLCALTGLKLSIECSSKKRSTVTASLDRIDSSRGYESGNVQWVHQDVNQMKWDLSQDRFIEICKMVTRYVE